MKKSVFTVLALSVLGILVLASGCVYDSLSSQVVVTEKVNVQFKEYRESPSIGSVVVIDTFKERLMDALEENHADLEDIETITMVAGEYKVAAPSKAAHDWTVSGVVTMRRQDDPMGPVTAGPATFVNMTSQSLWAAKGKPVPAALNSAGVAIVNTALADLKNGGDPRLIVEMVSDNIVPAPSPSDPLEFSWLAQVTFQVVIHVDVKK
ncbi:MAG: hypothetical protein H6Q78_1745 [Candidatus Krumholzibacteriota bacterium]|jgi:hypothetical protein|nr:hypothetical protein [Candidatus Krumholzibacteriota bacterium]